MKRGQIARRRTLEASRHRRVFAARWRQGKRPRLSIYDASLPWLIFRVTLAMNSLGAAVDRAAESWTRFATTYAKHCGPATRRRPARKMGLSRRVVQGAQVHRRRCGVVSRLPSGTASPRYQS